MDVIFRTSMDEESYSEYAKYAAITHTELLTNRWSFYEKSIIENLTKGETKSLVIADFGTSDGGNILPFLRKIIDFLKHRGFSGDVTFLFNDLPGNNFNVLIEKVKDLKNNGIEVHILMNACNMYERCLPKDTIDVGLSTYVLQLISKVTIEAGIGWNTATESERQVMKEQAAADWKQFLTHRYEEMKIGGYLILRFTNPEKFPEAVESSFLDIHKQGLINKDELRNINLSVYIRTEDEIRAPFQDKTCSFNFRIVDISKSVIPVSKTHGTSVSSFSPWIRNLLISGLSSKRDEIYVNKTVKELLRLYEARIRDFPIDHTFSNMDVIIQKTK